MTITENDMRELAAAVGQLLLARQMTCAAAESCTGGLVGHWITEIPGSSAYFAGAAVVYSYAAKERSSPWTMTRSCGRGRFRPRWRRRWPRVHGACSPSTWRWRSPASPAPAAVCRASPRGRSIST